MGLAARKSVKIVEGIASTRSRARVLLQYFLRGAEHWVLPRSFSLCFWHKCLVGLFVSVFGMLLMIFQKKKKKKKKKKIEAQ